MSYPSNFTLVQISGMRLDDPIPINGNEENPVTIGELLALSAVHYGESVPEKVLAYIGGLISVPVEIGEETWTANWFELREAMNQFDPENFDVNFATMNKAAVFLARQRGEGAEVNAVANRMIMLTNIVVFQEVERRQETIELKNDVKKYL